jgi:hypothetical protein
MRILKWFLIGIAIAAFLYVVLLMVLSWGGCLSNG